MVRARGGGCLLAPLLPPFLTFLFFLSIFRQAYGKSMCSILDQRTAIVDDRLFFCSGNYTFDDESATRHTTSSIYWLYLNETIDVTGPLNLNLLGSADLPDPSLSGGMYPDNGGLSGTFFYDHTTLYPYAGLIGLPLDGSDNILWEFNTSTNSWNWVKLEGDQLIPFANSSEGVYASDPRTGTSFYTGGYTVGFNSTYNGTVKFQSPDPGPLSWEFQTPSVGTMPGPNILKGAMVYVRKGRAGILIAFGGYQTAYQGIQIPDSLFDQRPFSDIYIFDIYSSTWYHQTATGDIIPELRTEFCAVVSSAPDDSSFQITIHGGWDQLNKRAFNDVYVLSVPSFRWIRVQDSNNPDLKGPKQPGRNRHKCNIWNETSMIVTGGELTDGVFNPVLLATICNPAYPPVKVLDTSTYVWQTEFKPNVSYSVPGVVSAVVGGGPGGGAQLMEPELGWESSELADIFSQTVPRDTYIPPGRAGSATPVAPATPTNTDGPSSSGGGTSKKPQDSGGLTTGAITGIAIGAVAAVAIIASVFPAVFFCRRSQRRKSEVSDKSATSSVMETSVFKGWHKPELDATTSQRYELGSENIVHEVHGEDIAQQKEIAEYWQTRELSGSSAAH
ncbi:hypothetical protein F5Y10DRAFT_239563 [Nemania abortiva]|nr:hypothetical protein F5Y10DRAFT_239563 [Nemania abortiva]